MLLLTALPASAASPGHAPLRIASRATSRHSNNHYARPRLNSASVLVVDQLDGNTIYEKNPELPSPIASITKLMTAMVVLDSNPLMQQQLTIGDDDVDRLRNSSSRLAPGTTLSRREMFQLSLMSSENRATSALARYYPGGKAACVAAMNKKAQLLGMTHTHYADPTGLDGRNTSTAEDLAKMVKAAHGYALIKQITTTSTYLLDTQRRGPMQFRNTNMLVTNKAWNIGLSKTGYINEAGHCLVMQAQIADRPMILVLLNAQGKHSGMGDANRIKHWLEGIGYGREGTRSVALRETGT